jgi:outer membrane scaffolding protein for murein synthesis (MipA/OmpV family)
MKASRSSSSRPALPIAHWWVAALALLLCAGAPRLALCQTPSPLQEWQYSGGEILASLFEPNLPDWRYVAGLSAAVQPLYSGSKPYRVEGGPVFDIRYRNVAFISVGEGIGVNFLHGQTYRIGVSAVYDLGRTVSDYSSHLRGLGDISAAPAAKLFASWVVSKKFPLVLRADARQFVGGADGAVGDLEAYMPLPGSSKRFVMFAGPSITFADHLYLQKEFGVTRAQALASGYPVFDPHPGTNAEGVGFSATGFITQNWLINVDGAIDRLRGSAAESPITQETVQRAIELTLAYSW